jgi:hypothetical protein
MLRAFLRTFLAESASVYAALMFAGAIKWLFTGREERDPAAYAFLWVVVVPTMLLLVLLVPIGAKALSACIKAKLARSPCDRSSVQ